MSIALWDETDADIADDSLADIADDTDDILVDFDDYETPPKHKKQRCSLASSEGSAGSSTPRRGKCEDPDFQAVAAEVASEISIYIYLAHTACQVSSDVTDSLIKTSCHSHL